MRIVDAQIHLWGSGLPSNMAHRQVTSFTTEEAVGLMDEGGVDAAVIHPPTSATWLRLREHLTGRLRCWRSVAVPLVQTGLAAGLSWFVAVHLFGHRAPLFAPVAATVCIDMTLGPAASSD